MNFDEHRLAVLYLHEILGKMCMHNVKYIINLCNYTTKFTLQMHHHCAMCMPYGLPYSQNDEPTIFRCMKVYAMWYCFTKRKFTAEGKFMLHS